MREYIVLLLMIGMLELSCATNFSIDLTTHSHLLKILNTHNEAINIASEQNAKIDRGNEMAGALCDNEALENNGNLISDFLTKTIYISSNSNYALMSVVEEPGDIDNWKNLEWTRKEVVDSLCHKEEDDGSISFAEMDRVKENRSKVTEESSKTGLALAATKQSTVPDTQKTVVEISKRANTSTNLHEDGMNTNQLLSVIATTAVENKQINAKMLELMSAFIMQYQTNVVKSAPLAGRGTKSSPSDSARLRASNNVGRHRR